MSANASRHTTGLFLFVLPLILVMGTGVFYNNLINSGMTATPTIVCQSGLIGDQTLANPLGSCWNTQTYGCQASSANCQLSGSSVSFLNGQSPFTFIFTGNILGLENSLNTNNGQAKSPFDPAGGGTFYPGSCAIKTGASTHASLIQLQLQSCVQTQNDNANFSSGTGQSFPNWNPQQTTGSLHGVTKNFNLANLQGNATYAFNVVWLAQVNYSSGATSNGYTWYGVDMTNTSSILAYQKPVWSTLISIPNSVCPLSGGLPVCPTSSYFHGNVYLMPVSWDTDICPNFYSAPTTGTNSQYGSQQCVNFINNVIHPPTGLNFGFLTPIITFLIGIILFVMGLGVSMNAGGNVFGTGTSFGIGTNTQGTRLAQVFGIGLIVWTLIESEFAGWINSTIVPFGLAPIVNLFATGVFFFGLYMATTNGQTSGS